MLWHCNTNCQLRNSFLLFNVHLWIFQIKMKISVAHYSPQAACNFASEIISFIPDPESGKVDKASPTQPLIPASKTNAGQTMGFVQRNWSWSSRKQVCFHWCMFKKFIKINCFYTNIFHEASWFKQWVCARDSSVAELSMALSRLCCIRPNTVPC